MKETNITKQQVTSLLEIRKNQITGYHSVFALQDVVANSVLSKFEPLEIFENPTRFTIQMNKNQHIGLKPKYLQYTNHNCNPNAFFDFKTMALTTLRNIKHGEEITFFYPSTEWEMTEAFDCICGADNCLKYIKGAINLTDENHKKYRLSDYVKYEYGKLSVNQDVKRF